MFQGRASSAGRCGASVTGDAWEVHAASQERHCKWRRRISPFWEKAKWEKWVNLMTTVTENEMHLYVHPFFFKQIQKQNNSSVLLCSAT